MWTRRQALAVMAAGAVWGAAGTRLSLEGYIWQNLANRARRPLGEMLEELFATAPYGGFENVELNNGFFSEELRERSLALIRRHGLRMPSVYVGGALHTDAGAEKTLARARELGGWCREFGCTAVVNNPDPKPKGAAKTDEELAQQARNLNRVGRALAAEGLQLRVHHHSPELENGAREWRHILRHTDPDCVTLCIDIEYVFRAGIDPVALLAEAGRRVTEIHVRNRIGNTPLEAFAPGDIDYGAVARALAGQEVQPLVVVELAYHDDTVITRPFPESVKASRSYAGKIFGI